MVVFNFFHTETQHIVGGRNKPLTRTTFVDGLKLARQHGSLKVVWASSHDVNNLVERAAQRLHNIDWRVSTQREHFWKSFGQQQARSPMTARQMWAAAFRMERVLAKRKVNDSHGQ